MATSHEDLQRSLGRLEGNQSQMEARMDRLEKLVTDGFKEVGDGISELRKEIGDLKAKENERKGAWKVIVTVAGGVSAAVAALIKYLTA